MRVVQPLDIAVQASPTRTSAKTRGIIPYDCFRMFFMQITADDFLPIRGVQGASPNWQSLTFSGFGISLANTRLSRA
jgi:hypothetical protein